MEFIVMESEKFNELRHLMLRTAELSERSANQEPDRIMTLSQAAEYLGVDRRWVDSRKKKIGYFKESRLIRIRKSDIENYLEKHTIKTSLIMKNLKKEEIGEATYDHVIQAIIANSLPLKNTMKKPIITEHDAIRANISKQRQVAELKNLAISMHPDNAADPDEVSIASARSQNELDLLKEMKVYRKDKIEHRKTLKAFIIAMVFLSTALIGILWMR